MKQQREFHGIGGKDSLNLMHLVEPADLANKVPTGLEEDKVVTNLRNLPLADPSQYSLLRSQYVMEKKAVAVEQSTVERR